MIERSLRTKNPINISIYLLIIVCSSKWIFEGVITVPILTPVFILLSICIIIISYKSIRIEKMSMTWFFYLLAILISLIFGNINYGILGKFSIIFFITLYVVMVNWKEFDVAKIIEVIVRIGLFHSVFIFIHYAFGERFNDFYFPLLNAESRQYAAAYFRGGRYFGVMFSPHELAGLISFAIFALFIWVKLNKQKKAMYYSVIFLLVISLLLTGKKGIIIIATVSLLFTLLIVYNTKKHWHKILLAIFILVIACIWLIQYIVANPDNILFNRFYTFIVSLSQGDTVDATRRELYSQAFNLWKDNIWIGTGWNSFRELTVTEFGFSLEHQVNCDYLQWLSEMGIIGLILTLIPITITLYRTVYICSNKLKFVMDNNEKFFILFAICVQIFTLIYAFIEVPFYTNFFYAIYILSCIIINGSYKSLLSSKNENKYKNR